MGRVEHPLSWRPSGNLIACPQRFSPARATARNAEEGEEDLKCLARGKDGQHDIIIFEPNGLRHGEFRLANERWLAKTKAESGPIKATKDNDRGGGPGAQDGGTMGIPTDCATSPGTPT